MTRDEVAALPPAEGFLAAVIAAVVVAVIAAFVEAWV